MMDLQDFMSLDADQLCNLLSRDTQSLYSVWPREADVPILQSVGHDVDAACSRRYYIPVTTNTGINLPLFTIHSSR